MTIDRNDIRDRGPSTTGRRAHGGPYRLWRVLALLLACSLLVAACGTPEEDQAVEPDTGTDAGDAADETAADEPADDATEEADPSPTEAEDGGRAELELDEIDFHTTLPNAQMAAQLHVADIKGYFEDEGLTVNLFDFEAGLIPQGMSSGDIQISTAGWVNPLLLATQGFEIDILSLTSNAAGTLGFVVKRDLGIETPKDFEGHRMAMLQVGVLNEAWARIVERYDIDTNQVEIVGASAGEGLAAFETGQVDIFFTFEPFISQAEQRGDGEFILSGTGRYENGEFVEDHHYSLWGALFANRDFVEANPNTIQALVTAMQRANDDLIQDPEGSAEVLAERVGLEPDDLLAVMERNAYDSAVFDEEWFDEYRQVGEYLHDIGELPNEPPDPGEFVNLEFLRRADADRVQVDG